MESSAEKPRIDEEILGLFKRECPELNARTLPAGFDEHVIVCDYSPLPVPWAKESPRTPDEERYERYLGMMTTLQERGFIADQISMRGYVDIQSCFRVKRRDDRQWQYVIPSSEYERIRESGIQPKTARMEYFADQWSIKNEGKRKDSEMQTQATRSLLGLNYDYLVPVISGLKPVAVDINVSALTVCTALSLPKHLQLLLKPEPVIYNPTAVTAVVKKHPGAFTKYGITAETPAKQVVMRILKMWRGDHHHDHHGNHDPQESEQMNAMIGLILGYDGYSSQHYADFKPDWGEGKDHPYIGVIPHQINEFPFNIWGVDYAVINPEENEGYQSLKEKYDELQVYIGDLLQAGMSPLEAMEGIPAWQNPGASVRKIRHGIRSRILSYFLKGSQKRRGHH